jgi:dipeptidyl aminopeptidase/acylaminoacyl peptidase
MPTDPEYIPSARIITFPTADGEVAHGVYYPPTNPGFEGPDGEKPPLILKVHGGPTSHVFPWLRPAFLYWTTRGFGLVDVNYRGSTGYGRRFRNLLRDSWGIADVEDCLAAARYLAAEGEVDGERLIITGGSAGGYTTLAALAFGDAFSAGGSYFGVADLGLLVDDTHKFESRYLDGLVGTDRDEMRRRSPLYSADKISVPVILFQGLEDKVVPPEQAELISAALTENGIPHAHITYEGEDHGFRKAENIIHSLESELAFYGKVLGFTPADDLPEVPMVVDPESG